MADLKLRHGWFEFKHNTGDVFEFTFYGQNSKGKNIVVKIDITHSELPYLVSTLTMESRKRMKRIIEIHQDLKKSVEY